MTHLGHVMTQVDTTGARGDDPVNDPPGSGHLRRARYCGTTWCLGQDACGARRCELAPESEMLPKETNSDVLAGCCVQILAKVVAASGETFFKVNSNGHEGFIKASYVNVHHRRERKRQRRS